MTENKQRESQIVCEERKKLFMSICELKPCNRPDNKKYYEMVKMLSKHFYVFKTKDKKIIVFDEPYMPSLYLERQPMLVSLGWQLQHLPTEMSLRWVGRCQPSLWAAPEVQVDLKFILNLLKTANFTGNNILTLKYQVIGR